MKKPFIIGITGGSASGKTMFLNQLMGSFQEDEICLISQDNYYNPLAQQPLDEEGVHNFDTPHSIDLDQYAKDLHLLIKGEEVQRQEYTFNNPNIISKLLFFKPAPIIVVEGLFVFYFQEIYQLLDLKIFIDAREHIKLKRRIVRDNSERGYDIHDVLYRYEKHVAPTYEKYIRPFKYDADILIPNNKSFQTAMEMLVIFLRSKIKN
ncbi:uridine kinase [soil metagenome]